MRKMTITENTEKVLKFTLPCEDGDSIEFDMLTTFELEDGKTYILFTDNTVDENGNVKVYPGVLYEETMEIEDITSEEDFAKMQNVVQQMHEMLVEEDDDFGVFDSE